MPATAPLGTITDCNSTWAMDFKGWFLTGDKQKCEPFTLTDCHSRYLLRCVHMDYHSVEHVWPVIASAFKEFGLPDRIRSDNGPPFGSTGAGRLTQLSVNLIKAGVVPEWIRPGHPEENGRHERLHGTLKKDVASPPKASLALQVQAMSEFRDLYNDVRPHEALDMKTPSECHSMSPRKWDGILRSPEYDRREMDVRKVCSSGAIWINGREHFISQTISGEYVGLKPGVDNVLDVYYGPMYLGKIGPNGMEKPSIASRRQR